MFELINTMAYLHNLNICHRDLNLENVLINPKDHTIKVIDFGISKRLVNAKDPMFSPMGNVNYRAPEFLTHGNYSMSSDVWQIGLIFAQMIRRENISTKKAIKIIDLLRKEEGLGENGRKLMGSMLEIDSEKRINCEEAMKCEWFKGMC